MERVGGYLRLTVDGAQIRAKGDFTYNLGLPKKETVLSSVGVAGWKETPQVCFIEGALTDSNELDLADVCGITNATVILELANGKSVTLREAFFAADGEGSTAEGEFKIRFEGASAEEVKA